MATAEKIAQLEAEQMEQLKSVTHWQRALRRLRRDHLTLVALAALGLLAGLAILAEPISKNVLGIDPFRENLQKTFAMPDDVNRLGTDNKGRDHLARLLYGAQISLSIAFAAAVLSLTIGVSLGIITGYYGGVVDDIMIWFITTLGSIPQLFLLLIVSALFTPGPVTLTLILGLLGWTGTLRLVRGETLGLREREFVVAARAMGASDLRLMFQHIMPNLISLVIVTLMIDIGALILVESALSFLGFGVAPPVPTWGNMLSNSQEFFRKAPHLVIMPGVLITITVLCLYIIGDGIRDALDPTVSE